VNCNGTDNAYHTECLRCSVCKTSLAGKLFVVREGHLVCEDDVKRDVPKCEKCSQSLYNAEMVVVKGKKFHVKCFACEGCGIVFGTTNYYYLLAGKYYCDSCKT